MYLPYQFTKYSFGSIASDRVSESLSDNNPDAARVIIHLVHHEIEERGRNSATAMFDGFNVPVVA
jgi:hypothetical protein